LQFKVVATDTGVDQSLNRYATSSDFDDSVEVVSSCKDADYRQLLFQDPSFEKFFILYYELNDFLLSNFDGQKYEFVTTDSIKCVNIATHDDSGDTLVYCLN